MNYFFVLTAVVMLSSCMKHHDKTKELNIDYPAAYIVNGEDATISVINLNTNSVSETITLMNHGGNHSIMWPHHIHHHKDHNNVHHLAVGVPGMDMSLGHSGGMGHGGKIAILDGTKGTITKLIDLTAMNHNAIYSPDGSEIWSSQMEANGKVLIYDAKTYSLKHSIAVGHDPAEVTFSGDGTKAYVSNGGSNSITVINPTTKAIITTISVGTNPVGAWPSPIGKMFVDNEDSKTISVIDVVSNLVEGTINLNFKPGFAAYHNSSNELWVSDATNGKVIFYKNIGSNNWVKQGELATGADAHAIAFSGNTAYVTNQGANTVSVIDVHNHTKTKDIPVGKKPNGLTIKL